VGAGGSSGTYSWGISLGVEYSSNRPYADAGTVNGWRFSVGGDLSMQVPDYSKQDTLTGKPITTTPSINLSGPLGARVWNTHNLGQGVERSSSGSVVWWLRDSGYDVEAASVTPRQGSVDVRTTK
jgi:hypothetical protein